MRPGCPARCERNQARDEHSRQAAAQRRTCAGAADPAGGCPLRHRVRLPSGTLVIPRLATSRPSRRVPVRRSPLAFVVLALLAESPMHPYRMQQLMPAALAFLGLFSCDDVLQQLRTRASALEQELAATAPADSVLPRVFLVEDEYLHAMTQAELRWVKLDHR